MGLIFLYASEFYPTSIRSVATAYFIIVQALTKIAGSFAVSVAVTVPQNWIFPAVFAASLFCSANYGSNYEL